MGIVNDIKNEAKNVGGNRSKILYVRSGEKKRVRFLTDMDDGMKVEFHKDWETRLEVPCQKYYGKKCKYCEMEDIKTVANYIWSVYDYDTEEVLLARYAFNNFTPVPQLLSIYENFGTLTDRDIVLIVSGKQLDKTFTCIHEDKSKFRNAKARPLSESAILKILAKAFPIPDDEEEDEKPAKGNKKKDDYMNAPEDDEDGTSYEDMTPLELYKECVKRNIECGKKKPQKYYIRLLEEDDKASDDWGDDDDNGDDEWEEDDEEGLPFR